MGQGEHALCLRGRLDTAAWAAACTLCLLTLGAMCRQRGVSSRGRSTTGQVRTVGSHCGQGRKATRLDTAQQARPTHTLLTVMQAMVNALGHCEGCTPPNLDAIWTLRGCWSPISERSSPIPERAGDSILSSRHRHGTTIPKAPARMRMDQHPRPTPTLLPVRQTSVGHIRTHKTGVA